jgi:hypothetical protein
MPNYPIITCNCKALLFLLTNLHPPAPNTERRTRRFSGALKARPRPNARPFRAIEVVGWRDALGKGYLVPFVPAVRMFSRVLVETVGQNASDLSIPIGWGEHYAVARACLLPGQGFAIRHHVGGRQIIFDPGSACVFWMGEAVCLIGFSQGKPFAWCLPEHFDRLEPICAGVVAP